MIALHSIPSRKGVSFVSLKRNNSPKSGAARVNLVVSGKAVILNFGHERFPLLNDTDVLTSKQKQVIEKAIPEIVCLLRNDNVRQIEQAAREIGLKLPV